MPLTYGFLAWHKRSLMLLIGFFGRKSLENIYLGQLLKKMIYDIEYSNQSEILLCFNVFKNHYMNVVKQVLHIIKKNQLYNIFTYKWSIACFYPIVSVLTPESSINEMSHCHHHHYNFWVVMAFQNAHDKWRRKLNQQHA